MKSSRLKIRKQTEAHETSVKRMYWRYSGWTSETVTPNLLFLCQGFELGCKILAQRLTGPFFYPNVFGFCKLLDMYNRQSLGLNPVKMGPFLQVLIKQFPNSKF